ncbi:ABC-type uncharacterized transport system, ATPase component [Halalkaliarchaeum sp. AArc-CO]|uniref:ABC transporter ATP-binding protein n=1 Tax=unclassified Halalkaliarchaeum TaxID=2678344 RepID=UPI00217E65D1|nr:MULTISPECIES: ABC transporter ATP-binding protein [unclassified Halalkaliarchaeum]MDR5673808.1 ABC transporter ATP-binding protein [Halalkaliarchaeum sp. AArc-GB]UWG50980.1 ABC-type uncharacterized transport system, ATPase component [Halalkaliarchaeum sp. AArc-CO]
MRQYEGPDGAEEADSVDYAVRMEGITKRFPGVVANDDVDFAVERGSVHALVGENGAGKTTLMNVLYGLYRPTEGRLVVDDTERTFGSPRDAIDTGIGMIHQHFMLIPPMTVAENMVLGEEPTKFFGLLTDEERAIEETRTLAERYGFDIDPTERVHEISVGEQQRLEILKALYRGADVLILDEPTAVLTPQEVESLFDIFDELVADGKTIIFITHKLGEALRAADQISVLRDGKLVDTVDTDETTREELATMMVGREVLLEVTSTPADRGETTLAVENLEVDDDRDVRAVDGVSFSVANGEIFGIAGVDGNGQSELVEAITGLRAAESGRIILDDEDVTHDSRRQRIAAGMSYIAEDRQRRSLVLNYDLRRNALLGTQRLPEFADGGFVDWDYTGEYTDTVIDEYDVRPPDPTASARSLSGGNQQKFVVGRELERDPSLVVASQPTRGVDIGSIEFVHNRLLDLKTEGVGLLLVSSKLEEVQRLSDRMAIMYDGRFMDVVDPDDVTEEEIGLLMAGEYPEGDDE